MIIRTFPAHAQRFRDYLPGLGDPLPPGAIGLEAEIEGVFAGTALLLTHSRSRTGSISVLHVPEMFRNLGIGSQLLIEAEHRLLEADCRTARVSLTLREGKPAPELEFLRKRGYGSEKLLYRSYTLRSSSMSEDSWMQRRLLPEEAVLEPLLDASEEDRAELVRLSASLPPDLSPFQEERLLHPEFSTLLKIGGNIAGWIGVQQLASNLLLLRTMYVRPEFQHRAGGIGLFFEMNRKYRLLERFAYQMLTVSGDNQAMLRLADRKFKPHASSIKSNVRLEKKL